MIKATAMRVPGFTMKSDSTTLFEYRWRCQRCNWRKTRSWRYES